ncbi:hypothetical protein ACLOJK_008317 [Asimina triloba]
MMGRALEALSALSVSCPSPMRAGLSFTLPFFSTSPTAQPPPSPRPNLIRACTPYPPTSLARY